MEEVPIQKSALQEFEAKLVLQEMKEPLLQRSIEEARRAGYLTSSKIRVALDTTPILGKGAVQDTYNLLGAAGGRDRKAGAAVAGSRRRRRAEVGRAAGIGRLFWQQPERGSGH